MQAILTGKHRIFCDRLQNVKSRLGGTDDALEQLEEEMLHIYSVYLQKMEELRQIVYEYEERKKKITNRLKNNGKYNLVE